VIDEQEYGENDPREESIEPSKAEKFKYINHDGKPTGRRPGER